MSFLLLFCVQVAWADGKRSDTLEVLYRVGQSDIDLSYAGNAKRIDDFVQRVSARMASSNAKDISLTIRSGASPEGLKVLNDRLGAERGIALRDVLKSKIPFSVNIPIINEGPRWAALRQMIQDSDEPWKEKALKILQNNPSENESEIDPMERQLRALDHGQVWQQIQAKYLSKLRSSGFAVIQEITEEQRLKDTLYIFHKDTIIYEPGVLPVYEPPVYYSRKPAIKTNFLLWGLGAPNIQLEIPLGKRNRWSIEGEFIMPWITWNKNSHAEQGVDVGFEIRYWLGNRMKRHTLDGWHIGLAAASGYYDIEWKKSEGYQGEFSNTYFNIGWQKRFGRNRHWAFDAGLGLGWIHTKYRHYLGSSTYPVGHEEAQDYHLMWQDDYGFLKEPDKHKSLRYSQRRNFFGATHANLSIAYFFGKQKYRAPGFVTPESIEAERQAREMRKQAKAADKEAASATRAAMNQARAEAKEQAKAQKMAAKLQADQEKEAERAAKAEAKAAKAAAKEAGNDIDKEAEKAAKAAAKEAEKAAKAAEKEAEQQAKAAAKAAKAAAKEAGNDIDKDAEKAAKAAAKEAEKAAKAQAKAAEEAAKAAEKEAAEQAKAAAKAAKEAEKAAEQEAKAAAKAAKAAAKEAGNDIDKDAEKAAKAAAKEAEKAAKAEAKAAEEAAKAAEKEAAEQVKAQAKAAKEAEKAAAAQAKEAEKAAAAQAKEAEKAAAAAAKEAEKAAKEQAKAAEAQVKEQAAAAKEAEKAAAAAAKEAEKAAKEKAKAEAAAAKNAEKAAAAAAKEAEKAAKEKAKAEAAAAKEAEKAAKEAAKAAEKAAKEAAKAEKSNAK